MEAFLERLVSNSYWFLGPLFVLKSAMNRMEMQVKSACGSVLQIITKKVPNLSSRGVQIGAHNFKKKWENRARLSWLAPCASESPKIILCYDFCVCQGSKLEPIISTKHGKIVPVSPGWLLVSQSLRKSYLAIVLTVAKTLS